jgi:effector-binding domain-containing protein
MIGEPKIDYRPEKLYMGIRTQTQFRGMFKVVDKLFKEMKTWAKQQKLELAGPPFLRFHVIDMEGEMDIEVGFPVAVALPDDGKITAGVIPAGRYASLIYSGSGYSGNKALVEWARANNLAWDRWDDPKGDGFRARYEAYLTAPNMEPRKSKGAEVAIKLADDQPSETLK